MAAGIVASIGAVTPTERIKTALVDDARNSSTTIPHQFHGPLHCTRTLIHEHGLLGGLYRGFWSTTLKQASTTAVRLGSYDILKSLETERGIDSGKWWVSLLNGSAVGAITVLTTQPFDCVKTRAQSARGEGLREAVQGVWRDGGLRGFWSGSTMRLGRNVCSGAVLFGVYERVVGVIRRAEGRA